MLRRALAIFEKAFGPEHPAVAIVLNNLGALHEAQGLLVEAEPLYRRALAIDEKSFGPNHPSVARDLNNLGALLGASHRFPEAERLIRRAVIIDEQSYGPKHPDVARNLNNLARLLQATNREIEAIPLYQRALTILEMSYGSGHPTVANALNNLAWLHAELGDWTEAAQFHRRAKPIMTAAPGREVDHDRSGLARASLLANFDAFRASARAVYNAGGQEVSEEGFELAQWGLQTTAGDALSQMSMRFAKGGGPLADHIRKQQDILARRQGELRRLDGAVGRADAKSVDDARATVAALDKALDAFDTQFATEFKEYAELANPKPLTVAATQKMLAPNEVLVLFLDVPQFDKLPEESLAWVITKSDIRWVKSELGTEALTERVTALRCGLDDEEWAGIERPARCVKLLNVAKPEQKEPLPFSLGIAHELYQALFGSVEDLIKDKHLLIVPSGPLTSLPFQVLVTEKPETALPKSYAGYRNVAWLGRRQPLTVLPSVASLRALREFAKGGRASQDYIGYGDPVLVGDGSCRKTTPPETCPSRGIAVAQAPNQVHQPRSRYSRRSPILTEVFSRGAGSEAVLAQVRKLCPLEDTAYEIKCIAQSLPKSKIRIRDEATVADIKALSDSGELATYRVVQFATHGLLAGDVELMTRLQGEPALVLTPPREPRDMDDNGLLTASKVAELKLNADWVVLSACNTAAGNRLGAEALSGLARAFFYAGARALLVSHWPVYSDAAVRLTTKAFAEIEAHATVTRAEAMRRAMVALMDDASEEDNAHPSVWAPFVVGEGGRQ